MKESSACRRWKLLADFAVLLAAVVGCAQPAPRPQEPAPSARCEFPCDALKLVVDYNRDKFAKGEPPPNTRAECGSLNAALSEYYRCGCPEEALHSEHPEIDGEAFGAWLMHCVDVLNGPPPTLALRE